MNATQLLKKKSIQTWDYISSGDEIIRSLFVRDLPNVPLMNVKKNLLIRKVFNLEVNDSFVYYKLFSLLFDDNPVLFYEETHQSKKLWIYKQESFNDLIQHIMQEICLPAKFIEVLEPKEELPVNEKLADLKMFYDTYSKTTF